MRQEASSKQQPSSEGALVRAAELAQMFGVSTRTVGYWVNQGYIQPAFPYQFRGHKHFSIEEVQRFAATYQKHQRHASM